MSLLLVGMLMCRNLGPAGGILASGGARGASPSPHQRGVILGERKSSEAEERYRNAVSALASLVDCRISHTLSERCRDVRDPEVWQRLALGLANCHLDAAGRITFACPQSMSVRDCLPRIPQDSEAIYAYTVFTLHIQSVCTWLEEEAWRGQTERLIDDLGDAARESAMEHRWNGEMLRRQRDSMEESISELQVIRTQGSELLASHMDLISALDIHSENLHEISHVLQEGSTHIARMRADGEQVHDQLADMSDIVTEVVEELKRISQVGETVASELDHHREGIQRMSFELHQTQKAVKDSMNTVNGLAGWMAPIRVAIVAYILSLLTSLAPLAPARVPLLGSLAVDVILEVIIHNTPHLPYVKEVAQATRTWLLHGVPMLAILALLTAKTRIGGKKAADTECGTTKKVNSLGYGEKEELAEACSTEENLKKMSRRELQLLAKKFGISARERSAHIIERLLFMNNRRCS
jgi:hypothetical protein